MNFSSSVSGAIGGGCLFVALCFFLYGAMMKLSKKGLKNQEQRRKVAERVGNRMYMLEKAIPPNVNGKDDRLSF